MRGAVRGVHYSASKGGVVSMTRAMALELAPHNIRVNAIAPGTTDTAQPRYGNTDAELIEMARATIPLGGKLLAPDQIARSAVFLASDEADAITGQVLHVNGGSYMAVSASLAAGKDLDGLAVSASRLGSLDALRNRNDQTFHALPLITEATTRP